MLLEALILISAQQGEIAGINIIRGGRQAPGTFLGLESAENSAVVIGDDDGRPPVAAEVGWEEVVEEEK